MTPQPDPKPWKVWSEGGLVYVDRVPPSIVATDARSLACDLVLVAELLDPRPAPDIEALRDAAPSSITHLAGTAITWAGQFLRQRCEWCGAILEDIDLTRIAMQIPEGKTEEQARADGDLTPATWPTGSFVRVDGEFPKVMSRVEAQPSEEDPTQTQAPEDSCMRLDPAVTA